MNESGNNKSSHWSSFLQFNIGHLLIMLGMLGSAVWWFVTYDREFTITRLTVASLAQTVKEQSQRIESIDGSGTRFSQRNIDKELDLLKTNSERVTKLEQINVELLPKVERMTFQLATVAEWVNEQKQRANK